MKDCIFCQVARGEAPSWKVYENEHAYAFLNINSVSRYHTLVIPKDHYVNIFDASALAVQEVMAMVQYVSKLYQDKLGIEDIQIITNAGAAAQQTVFHWHVHIVPRAPADGLDIEWTTYPEWRGDFDEMLEKLQ
ncbi:MAG: HIT family protein [Saprospiraceae bacterium]|nr:HIT family protein [Saprospiraceae bacterium]